MVEWGNGGDSIIPVVAGVIRGADDRILLARRPEHLDQGGLWEFPGGKREAGERRFQALARELDEELNIIPTSALPLIKLRYAYPNKTVELDVWEVLAWDGCASGAEGQRIAWVGREDLSQYEFPKANETIVRAAQLPRVIVDMPEKISNRSRFVRQARNWMASGCLVFGSNIEYVVAELSGAEPNPRRLCMDYDSVERFRFLTESFPRPTQFRPWAASRCANVDELAHVPERQPDIIIVDDRSGSRLRTQKSPDWRVVQDVVSRTTIPVYVGGEIAPADMPRALAAGCQGIVLNDRYWLDEPNESMHTIKRGLRALSCNPDELETPNFAVEVGRLWD